MAEIENFTSNTLLSGTSGNDSIYNNMAAQNVTVQALGGNDEIYNTASSVTIEPGAGNDVIENDGSNVLFVYSGGNDSIAGFNSTSTLQIAQGTLNPTVTTNGEKLFLTVGSNKITLAGGYNEYSEDFEPLDKPNIVDAGGNVIDYKIYLSGSGTFQNTQNGIVIQGSDGNDRINNGYSEEEEYSEDETFSRSEGGNSVSIYAKAGNDFIRNLGHAVSIDASDGADTIKNGYAEGSGDFEDETYSGTTLNGGYNALIEGGAGNDRIISCGNQVSIDGGDGADFIQNGFYEKLDEEYYDYNERVRFIMYAGGGSSSSIAGGAGNDTIHNGSYASNTSIFGGTGNDFIANVASQVTIDAGLGNDFINNNSAANALIIYSGGLDTIRGLTSTSTIQIASDGFDSLAHNRGDNLVLTIGNDSLTLDYAAHFSVNIVDANFNKLNYKISSDIQGDDFNNMINNTTDNATIDARAGNDGITNSGNFVSISGGDGADTITNSGKNSTIDGNGGSDVIYNNVENVTINGGAGLDKITTYYSNIIIDGGDDNDTITAVSDSSINAGAGNDRISMYGGNSTIFGGAGDDIFSLRSDNYNNLIVYYRGDGSDSIRGFSDSDSLQIVGGSYSMIQKGNNVIVTVGEGNLTLQGAAGLDAVNIIGDGGWKKVTVTSSGVYIKGTDDGCTIYNGGSNNTILGGQAGDYIYNSGSNVSISGGEGSDTIHNYASNLSTILGGAAGDYIFNSSNNVTIQGGAGNDSITLNYFSYDYSAKNTLIEYTSGDGFDTVLGFNEDDTLSISGGSYSTQVSGADVVVNVGDGAVTLQNVYTTIEKLHINGETIDLDRKVIELADGGDSISITRDSFSVKGGAGNDSIDNFGDNSSLDSGAGSDRITNGGSNVTIDGGADNDRITNSGSQVTIDSGAGSDRITNGGSQVTIDSGAGSDRITNGGSQVSIDSGDGADTINNSGTKVTIIGGSGNDSIFNTAASISVDAGASNDKIITNGAKVTLMGGAGSDLISLGSDAKNNLIVYNAGDGSDSIEGFKVNSTLSIGDGTGTYSTVKSGMDIIVTVDKSKVTLSGATLLSRINIAGKKSSPASTLQTVTNSTASPLQIGASIKSVNASKRTTAIKITGNALANSISGGSKADSIYGGAGNDTILGNAGADKLFGEAGNDKLFGGAGNDTLDGGLGNDSLTGGDGKDLFIYSGGKDLITDYEESDKISIASGAVSKVSTSGSNVILTVGANKVTVKGGKDKVITYIDSGGEHVYPQTVDISGSTIKLLKAYSKDSFKVADYGSNLTTINAAAVTHDLDIIGNKLANKITGTAYNDSINGGAGNDTILGGKGDDTLNGGLGNDNLTGGAGSDIFVYSGGKDIITDYEEADKISLTGAASISIDGADVIFNGKITVTGAADKTVTYIDSGGEQTFFDENKPVEISGKKITLTEDYMEDNFNVADYGANLQTIDASRVQHAIQITGNKLKNKIIGSSEDDWIYGAAGADTILGSDGNDTILGGKGNDSLSGGSGSDVFIYSAGDGNDIIADYAQEDKISIAGTANVTTSGNNVILTVGSGKITVKGAKDKVVTYIDSTGTNYYPKDADPVILSGNGVTLRANYSKALYSAGAKILTIDASDVTRDLKIMGNGLANDILSGSGNDSINGGAGKDTISGGSGDDKLLGGSGNDMIFGGEGNDTITGGAGNDELWGDEGSDTFIYKSGHGKDVIYNFGDEDALTFNNLTFTTSYKDDAIVFKVGTTANAITLKDFTATTFNIDGKAYKISSSSLVVRD